MIARSKRSLLVAQEAERVEVVGDAAVLVQDAHDDRLAVHAGQRDDAQVDVLAVDREPDAAVLRHAALGDVEVAHDLHAADRAGDHPLGDRRRLLQHAVDAEAHAQLTPVGGEVHVGGARLHRLGDDLVDELDDRRLVAALAQLDDLGGAGRRLLLELGGLDDVVQARQAADQLDDVLARGDGRPHVVAGHHGDVVDRHDVARVGHREQQRASRRSNATGTAS